MIPKTFLEHGVVAKLQERGRVYAKYIQKHHAGKQSAFFTRMMTWESYLTGSESSGRLPASKLDVADPSCSRVLTIQIASSAKPATSSILRPIANVSIRMIGLAAKSSSKATSQIGVTY